MSAVLPTPGDWNDAVRHSLDYPTHILGPYEDDDGNTQMCCDGSGDPYEPSNCDFDTGRKPEFVTAGTEHLAAELAEREGR